MKKIMAVERLFSSLQRTGTRERTRLIFSCQPKPRSLRGAPKFFNDSS